MLRSSVRPILLFVLSASLFNYQTGAIQVHESAIQHPPSADSRQNPKLLMLELDRALSVLKQGVKENWRTRDHYLSVFEKTPDTDSIGRSVTEEKKYVDCSIRASLRTHRNWDEGPPIGVEVQRAVFKLTKLRGLAEQATAAQFSDLQKQPAEFQLPPCAAQRIVTISAGLASGMLIARTAPIYPADVHVFGTVVLDATIDTVGHVERLRVISGPPLLYEAALDAVRKWTYKPYILNNEPIEFKTTIAVVFAPPS